MKFPVDAPRNSVLKAIELLGFVVVREGNHIILERKNADGTITPLVLPNHRLIKSSTLRRTLTQAGIDREGFLDAYSKV
ncbi:MAG: type II toxin-antitoxin system HicA family toxin [Ignavibacteriae bacterium]|nr:type II toxin-antitoxin system HicA family toxin [Ignavibacteriota bacterium]